MAKEKKKKWIRGLILGVALLLIGTIVFSCYQLSSSMRDLMTGVGTPVRAEKGPIQMTVQGTGELVAADKIDVTAPLTGKIQSIKKENGDLVTKGDLMLIIDDADINLVIDELGQHIAQLDTQLRMLGRPTTSTVKSPVAGTVKAIYVEENQTIEQAMATSTGLMLISPNDKMYLAFVSAEKLAPGDVVDIVIDDDQVQARVDRQDGDMTIIVLDDDGYPVDASAKVYRIDGAYLGAGNLDVYQPFWLMATTGQVRELTVDIGSRVRAGQTVIRLETAVPTDEYNRLLEERQRLADQLSAAQKAKNARYVYAPDSGIVENLIKGENAMASEDEVLLTISQTDAFDLEIKVDELDVSDISVGQIADVYVDALSHDPLMATVTHISGLAQREAMSRVAYYKVTLTINTVDNLRIGMSARAEIVTHEKEQALLILATALEHENKKTYVSLLPKAEDEEQAMAYLLAGEAHRVEVQTGLYDGLMVEITSGLEEGDFVVNQAIEQDPFMQFYASGV